MVRVFINLIVVLFYSMGLMSKVAFGKSGDIEAGKQKSAICVSCHGQNGVSVSNEFPHIAGQVPSYIALQLAKFKSGERNNAIMSGIVANLSKQDMLDLDAYYASQQPNNGFITPEQEKEALIGGRIYRTGYEPYKIAACMGCHGPSGHGIPPKFPRVSGQSAKYLETQLLAFKSGQRQAHIMNRITLFLSEEQIKQLSLYMSAIN